VSKKTTRLFTIGSFALVAAILLSRFAPTAGSYAFFEGLLFGLSMTVNIGALILWRREKATVTSKP